MKYIYHITSRDNLEDILKNGAVICKNKMAEAHREYVSIAYESLQERRHNTKVPLKPGGNLHDYVPFHFAPKSPMLYAIHRGNVTSFQKGQEKLIYLVVRIEDVIRHGLDFVFTDGHPIMEISEFFNDLSLLEKIIDWPLMEARYWRDTEDDPDRKRRRQAEFLIYQKLPVELIDQIGVFNMKIKKKVYELLRRYGYKIECRVKRNWYY